MLNLEKRDFAAAIDSFDDVIKERHKDYLAHLMVAQAYLEQGSFQSAIDESQQALRWGKRAAKTPNMSLVSHWLHWDARVNQSMSYNSL